LTAIVATTEKHQHELNQAETANKDFKDVISLTHDGSYDHMFLAWWKCIRLFNLFFFPEFLFPNLKQHHKWSNNNWRQRYCSFTPRCFQMKWMQKPA